MVSNAGIPTRSGEKSLTGCSLMVILQEYSTLSFLASTILSKQPYSPSRLNAQGVTQIAKIFGIYSSIGPTSTLEELPTTWENRGLERLEVSSACA